MVVNHYTALNLSTNASPQQIQRAYDALFRDVHPDQTEEDDELFVQRNIAYYVLIDPIQRADYDAILRNSFSFDTSSSNTSSSLSSTVQTQASQSQQPSTPSLPSSPTPPTSELLTSQRHRLLSSPSPVPMALQRARLNIEATVNITLEEAYTGAEIGVIYHQMLFCDVCEGAASTIVPFTCTTCHGEQRTVEREILVTIERGIHDNHIIHFFGMGNISPDDSFVGDLIITLRVPEQSTDRVFTRAGNDLHITQVLTLRELVTGYENKTMCTHMDGQIWSASQPFGSVINPNHILAFLDGGMPLYQSMTGERGDLHVHFNFNFPQQLHIPDDPVFRNFLSIALENDEERAQRHMNNNEQNDTPPVPSTEHHETQEDQSVAATTVNQEHEASEVITPSSPQQENQPDHLISGNEANSEHAQSDEHSNSAQDSQSSTNHALPDANGSANAYPLLPNNALPRTTSTSLLSPHFSPTLDSNDEDYVERYEYYPDSPQLRTNIVPHINGDNVSNHVNNTQERQVNSTPRSLFSQPQYTLQYAGSPFEAVPEYEESQLPSYYPPSPNGRSASYHTLNGFANQLVLPQVIRQSTDLLFGDVDEDSGNLTGENSNHESESSTSTRVDSSTSSEESTDTREDTNDSNEEGNDTREGSNNARDDDNISREESIVTIEISNETSEASNDNYDASAESNDVTEAIHDSKEDKGDGMEDASQALQGIFTSSADTTPESMIASLLHTSVQADIVKQEDQSQNSTQGEIIDLVSESRSDSLEKDLRTKRNRDMFDAEDKLVESPKRRKFGGFGRSASI